MDCKIFWRTWPRARSRRPTSPPSRSGRNVATSEGTVVFENDLIQLIQVQAIDAQGAGPAVPDRAALHQQVLHPGSAPENSFVRFCVERGNTVFMISWRNPGQEQEQVDLGRLRCARSDRGAERRASDLGADKVNALGFCVGGTLLATALAVMRRRAMIRSPA